MFKIKNIEFNWNMVLFGNVKFIKRPWLKAKPHKLIDLKFWKMKFSFFLIRFLRKIGYLVYIILREYQRYDLLIYLICFSNTAKT